MPHLAQPYDYNALASSLLNKLLPILGRDAVIQTSYSIRELELTTASPNRTHRTNRTNEVDSRLRGNDSKNGNYISVKVVRGDSQVVFDQLVEEFRELSPFVVEKVMGELHEEQEGN